VITHTVSFRWKPEIPDTQLAVITDALRALAATIPEVRSYHCGSDLGVSTQPNYDYAIVATFDDVDGVERVRLAPQSTSVSAPRSFVRGSRSARRFSSRRSAPHDLDVLELRERRVESRDATDLLALHHHERDGDVGAHVADDCSAAPARSY
jgi:hypothetical protein